MLNRVHDILSLSEKGPRTSMADTSLDAQPRIEGTVLQWNEKGFGFIGLPDERRAYVHCSQFGGGNLIPGEQVTAVIVEDPINAGKWQAKHVKRSFFPQEAPQSELLEGSTDPNRLQCVVAEWNLRGFGFILVPDGRRAYVHVSQTAGKNLHEGESVVATIVQDKQNLGKWAAEDVKRVQGLRHSSRADREAAAPLGEQCLMTMQPSSSSSADPSAAGGVTRLDPGSLSLATGLGMPSSTAPGSRMDLEGRNQAEGMGASRQSGQRMEGTVVEWFSERGFGYIDLKDGRRAYVHHSAFGGGDLQAGVTVNGVILEDQNSMGKWRAEDVQLGKWPPMQSVPRHTPSAQIHRTQSEQQMGQMDVPDSKMASVQMANLQMQMASQQMASQIQTAQMAQMEQMAQMAQMEQMQMSQMASMGMMAMQSPMGPMMVPVMMGGGSMMPVNPMMCPPMMGSPAAAMSGANALGGVVEQEIEMPRYEGVVVKWEDKGYGFVEFGPNKELPEKIRAYCHSKSFGGGDLAVGEVINAQLSEDKKNPGKWAVDDVLRGPLGEDGTLINWKQDKGFGFVEMDDGRRAYIHHSSFGGGNLELGVRLRVVTKPDELNPGKWSVAAVKCELSPDEDQPSKVPQEEIEAAKQAQVPMNTCIDFMKGSCTRGELCRFAHSATPPKGGTPSGLTRMCSNYLTGICLYDDNCKFAHSMRANPACEKIPEQDQRQATAGVVAEWATKGFGFILLEDNRRAYVHHSAFSSGNLEVGERVQCVVIPDRRNRGKFMVESLTREESLTKQVVEEWTPGKVVEFNRDRKDGYIKLEDGRKCYVPASVLFGGFLILGEELQAKPTQDKNNPGQWMVVCVRGDGVVGGANDPNSAKRPRLF